MSYITKKTTVFSKLLFLILPFIMFSFPCIAENAHVPVVIAQEWHNGIAQSISYTPDGRCLLTYGGENVKLWDVATGRLIRTFDDVHHEPAVSADGKGFFYRHDFYAQNGSLQNYCLRYQDFETGATETKDEVQGRSFISSSDGKYVLSFSFRKEVTFYSPYTFEKLFTIPLNCTSHNEKISTDSEFLFFQDYDSKNHDIIVIDIKAQKIAKTFSFKTRIKSYAISPDGRYIAVIFQDKDDGILVLSTFSSAVGTTIPTDGTPSFIQFFPDGKRILYGCSRFIECNNSIVCFDIESSRTIFEESTGSSDAKDAAFSPDGKTIAINMKNGIEIRSSSDGSLIRGIKSQTLFQNTVYVPAKDFIWIFEPTTGNPWNASILFDSTLNSLPFSRELSHFNFSYPAFFDKGIYFLEFVTDRKVSNLAKYDFESKKIQYMLPLQSQFCSELATSADGKVVTYFSPTDKKLYAIDVESGNMIGEWTTDGSCQNLIMSENGRFLAYVSHDTCVVVNIQTGETFKNGDIGLMDSGTFTPDGTLFITHEMQASGVQIYSTETFQKVLLLKDVLYACFSRDSHTMALFTGDACFIYDLQSRKIINNFPTISVRSAFFSADGKKLFLNSWGGKLSCHDIPSGKTLASANADKNGNFIAYTPEGYFKGNNEGIRKFIHLVDGLKTFDLGQFYEVLYRPDLVERKLTGLSIDSNPLISLLSSGTAPTVSFNELPVYSEKREIEVSFTITDTGGGIGKIYLSDNDRIIQIPNEKGTKKGGKLLISYTCTLDNGVNTFHAYAENASGTMESLHAVSATAWTGNPGTPDLFVLSIGVNKYASEKIRNLKYAVPDMSALAGSFRESSDGLYGKISTMELSDESATKENIAQAFNTLSSIVKADDVFVLFISGHGTTTGGEYYFIPHDFSSGKGLETAISKHFLTENMSKLLAKKTVILLDTCNSGAFISASSRERLSASGQETPQEKKSTVAEKTAVERLVHTSGQIVLTASADFQSAFEGLEGHGVFTYCILEALSGKADLDKNGVSVKELLHYVQNTVPYIALCSFGYIQTPWGFFQGRDFVLIPYGDNNLGNSCTLKINPNAKAIHRYHLLYDNSSENYQ